MKLPLQGKQRRRDIVISITSEEYDALLFEQAEHQRIHGQHVSISRLARDAFEDGIRDEYGSLPGETPAPQMPQMCLQCGKVGDHTRLCPNRPPVDTGRLRDSWKVIK